jgi:ArsR family transcriptional regulator, arsenate/arsenite/antimonite-responsive transcriptional repressor / arsenate reductase (thioredoxin)
MTTQAIIHPPELLKLLAHDLRWGILKTLSTSDHRVHELVSVVNEPMNLVSYHLKKLRENGIVTTRRSEADGRDMYYSLDLGKLRNMYQQAGAALHPGITADNPPQPVLKIAQPLRVLFVCTHNSARSQMAEGLLRHKTRAQMTVLSAGSQPTTLHPDAITTMDKLGIDIREQASKPIEAVKGQSFDYVISVCDRAREVCPTFPGESEYLHWGFIDPANVGDNRERRHAFAQIATQLATRIDYFLVSVSH